MTTERTPPTGVHESAPSGARGETSRGSAAWARSTPTGPHTVVLSGATVVLPTGTVPDGRVIVEGTRIAGSAPEGAPTVDLSGHWVVPGFVDMHNHGGGGASFTSGTVEEILQGVRTHRLHGTTTLVASTVTGDMDGLA
jgi:N-acetylglucosamine-6-phosphate deacetylase